jgi:hypothetical protein
MSSSSQIVGRRPTCCTNWVNSRPNCVRTTLSGRSVISSGSRRSRHGAQRAGSPSGPERRAAGGPSHGCAGRTDPGSVAASRVDRLGERAVGAVGVRPVASPHDAGPRCGRSQLLDEAVDEPCLAAPRRPLHHDQAWTARPARVGPRITEVAEFVPTSDERLVVMGMDDRGDLDRRCQIEQRAALDRAVGRDHLLDAEQLRRRLEPHIREPPTHLLQGEHGVAPTTAARLHQRQECPTDLPVRFGLDRQAEPLDRLGRRIAARRDRQFGVDRRRQPLRDDVPADEHLIGVSEVAQHHLVPRPGVVPAQPDGIVESIRVPDGSEQAGCDSTDAGDVVADRRDGVAWWVVAPHALGHPVDRHGVGVIRGERCEDGALLRPQRDLDIGRTGPAQQLGRAGDGERPTCLGPPLFDVRVISRSLRRTHRAQR